MNRNSFNQPGPLPVECKGAKAAHRRSEVGNNPLLHTVPEVADLLRITPKAAYSMIERAQLPGVVKFGRRVRVKRAVLLDWLDHNSAPSLENMR